MEAISFLMPRPGRTNNGRIRSLTCSVVSRTNSRKSGCCLSRRGRLMGKSGVGEPIMVRSSIKRQKSFTFTIHTIRRRHSRAWRDFYALNQQALLQRGQEEKHIGGPRRVPHEADAPDLAL